MRIKNKWTCVPFIAVLITILIFSFSFDSSTACYAKIKKKAVKIVTYSSYSEAVVKLRQAAINTQTVNFRLKMSKKTSVSRLAERIWKQMEYDNGTSKRGDYYQYFIGSRVYYGDFNEHKRKIGKQYWFYGTLTPDDKGEAMRVKKADKMMKLAEEKIKKENPNADQAHLVLAIHDYIILNTKYADYDLPHYGQYYVWSAFLNKQIVCIGYAGTFYQMCRDMGIPCRLIPSAEYNNVGHAYNLVKLDGKWYWVDSCWDDYGGNRVSYNYFLRGSDNFAYTGYHKPDPKLFTQDFQKKYPIDTQDYPINDPKVVW